MGSFGFKEWSLVCDALGSGRQSIILRKGGIAEGRDGFAFNHPEFFLFPTWFHEQRQKVRNGETSVAAGSDADAVQINHFARVDLVRLVKAWSVAEELEPLHILRSEVVRERFDYDGAPGLHVALVRVFRVTPAWSFPTEPRFGGCRSWVKLPEQPNDLRFERVLSEHQHQQNRVEFLRITDAL